MSPLILPIAIGTAGLAVVVTVALVLRSRRTRAQDRLDAETRLKLAEERRRIWRRRLGATALAIAFAVIFCIAAIAAWLSFGAQRQYAFDRNGGSWNAATGFALLLDAGALGLSLMRLFEALTARSSQLTRFYLAGFIVASATMNLLHAPHEAGEPVSVGSRLVAVIPPLVYAIFLETLLKKVEQLVLGQHPKRKKAKEFDRGHSLLLWVPWPIGAPVRMWRAWREDLLSTIPNVRAPGSMKARVGLSPNWETVGRTADVSQSSAGAGAGASSAPQEVHRRSALPEGALPEVHLSGTGAPQVHVQSAPEVHPADAAAPGALSAPVEVHLPGARGADAEVHSGGKLHFGDFEPEVQPHFASKTPEVQFAGPDAPARADSAGAVDGGEVRVHLPGAVHFDGAESARALPEVHPAPAEVHQRSAPAPEVHLPAAPEVHLRSALAPTPTPTATPERSTRRTSKKDMLLSEMSAAVERGDMSVFSSDDRVRNAAAYAANEKLSDPLKHNVVRNYVRELLPVLEAVRDAASVGTQR